LPTRVAASSDQRVVWLSVGDLDLRWWFEWIVNLALDAPKLFEWALY
jgi:hypothetical protein